MAKKPTKDSAKGSAARRSRRRRSAGAAVKPASAGPTFAGPRKRPLYASDEVIVRVHPAAVRPHWEHGEPTRGAGGRMSFSSRAASSLPAPVIEPIDHLRRTAGLTDIEPLVAPSPQRRQQLARFKPADRARLAVASSVLDADDDELAGLAVARLSKPATPALLNAVAAANSVDFIERLPARWLMARGADPMRNSQWGLRAIRWFEADLPDVSHLRVGVMDTGLDVAHPDLTGIDVTYDHALTSARDIIGHGTHVAGIIAARANNAIGIAGVAQTALAVWKIFGDKPAEDGEFYVDGRRFQQALVDASRSGITSLNLSIGGTASSRTEQLLFRRLAERGVTTVAAMGNEFEVGNPVSYPAAYDDVVAVGAIAEARRRSSFSNTGRHIDIAAPGSNILSTLPTRKSVAREETDYAAWSGTSMATPHVAAAVALIVAKHPTMKPADVTKHLRRTAAHLDAMGKRARTNEYGAGLLNLEAALS